MNPTREKHAINRAIKCLPIPRFFRRGARGDASEASTLFTFGNTSQDICRITGRSLVAQIFTLALIATCGALLVIQFSDRINAGETAPKLLLYPTADRAVDETLYLTGHSQPDTQQTVEHNGMVVGTTYSNEMGDFAYALRLTPGENHISVKTSGNRQSQTEIIRYRPLKGRLGNNTPRAPAHGPQSETGSSAQTDTPALNMPVILTDDNTSSPNPAKIEGHADPNVMVNLFVNGRRVSTARTDIAGNFRAKVPLLDGENAVYVLAESAQSGFDQSPISNTAFFTYNSNLQGGCDNTIGGAITEDTVWTEACSPYEFPPDASSFNVTILNDVTLWIQEGVEVLFPPHTTLQNRLIVHGILIIQGTETNPAVFRPTTEECHEDLTSWREDWYGIRVDSIGWATMEYADIRCALRGVHFEGGDGTVLGSTFASNSHGISILSNSFDSVTTPHVSDNLIEFNGIGISITGSSEPVVEDNDIQFNSTYGVNVRGFGTQGDRIPAPVVQHNSIFGNNGFDYYAHTNFGSDSSAIVLDATYNWWGTEYPSEIASNIHDYSNDLNSPVVDFGSFLDGPDGNPVPVGPILGGPVLEDITLDADEYLMVNPVRVEPGVTLTPIVA